MSLLTQSPRLYDDKPWAAHIYVTDQCNLDCGYCNEYDNSVPHPETADLKRWMTKIRDLGVKRLGFLGGEPLMHPDLVELVRFGRQLGFDKLSMSTNGFLLTKPLLRALEDAGLDQMQFSIDRLTPNDITKKSMKTVRHKLAWFRGSPIRFNVNSVLCDATVDEVRELIDTCLREGVGAHARIIHDDLIHDRKLRLVPSVASLQSVLSYQAELKALGERIHTSWNLLDFQQAVLRGQMPEWKCVAGYKYFFVSARGKLWPCSQVRTDRDIMDITPEDLKEYDVAKTCQTRCGVWCIVDMSLAVNNPLRYLAREAAGIARSRLVQLRRKSGGTGPSASPPGR